MKNVQDRFLEYIQYDTQSIPDCECIPSTEKQKLLGARLVNEMLSMGMENAHMDGKGYVYGYLSATPGYEQAPVLGLIAHMDTSPDLSGKNVKARVVTNYHGEDITLNREQDIVLKVSDFPQITKYEGEDLIVTDGTTLLGADDKAGIAEIMTAMEQLLKSGRPHGKICVGFTPDEEIGRGADFFDIKNFGADFAYTVDGGEAGEIEFENFNAASAKITIRGVNIHPGMAKDKMINSLLIAMEVQSLLPEMETPAHTEGYEGFCHLNKMEGTVERTHMHYILRDHNMDKLEQKKERMLQIASKLNEKYGRGTVTLELQDSYYNMKEKILPHYHLVENACTAIQSVGLKPKVIPIRGGTDGARLSFMGLPCPNLGTGGHNAHGKFEYISVNSMEKTVSILLKILDLYSKIDLKKIK